MTYLSPERTIKRKVQEAILARWMERRLGKEEILSRYLNTAYFGAGVYGVDAAAKRYFGKTAKELSLSEAAMLAGLVRAPSALAPTRHFEEARQRAALVLKAVVETGAVSREQAEAARRQPVSLRVPPDNPPGTNYFVDVLGGDVKRLVDSAASTDLTVRSTLDLDLQGIAEGVTASAQGGRAGQESRSGCPRRLGTRRRHPRDGGWTRLQRKPIQSRRPGQAAARLPVQALCLPRRLPEGPRSPDDGRRSTGSDRRLRAGELRRALPRTNDAA